MKKLLSILVFFFGLTLCYAQNPVIPWPAPPYNAANISFSTSGNQTIVAADTKYATCIYGLLLVNSGATGTTISVYQDGGTTAVSTVYLAAGGGAVSWQLIGNNPKNPYFITNTKTAFVINSGSADQINGTVYAAQCP